MKKVKKHLYCSRCGCEISVEERRSSTDTSCGLCSNMQMEAKQIWLNKRQTAKPILSIVPAIKSQ